MEFIESVGATLSNKGDPMTRIGDIFKLGFSETGNLACIDIDEPIYARPGEVRKVLFRYQAGIPHSTAFDIWWFFTLENADALQNRLDPAEHPVLPITTIDPPVPAPATGDWQSGVVTITMPESYPKGFILFGTMIIDQPDV